MPSPLWTEADMQAYARQHGYVWTGEAVCRALVAIDNVLHDTTTPPTHRTPRVSEEDEQIALMQWRDLVLDAEPRLAWLYHIPNGKQRSKAAGGRLRAMGVKPGMPDLFLPVPRRGFHGCYQELKRIGGQTPSGAQQRVIEGLRKLGYYVGVPYGWVAAARELCWYLERKDLAP